MESRIRVFLLRLALLGMAVAGAAGCASKSLDREAEADQARPVIDPQVERRDVSRPKVDTEDFEVGGYIGFLSIEDFGSNTVYGARLAYHITEGLFAEATLGQSDAGKTSYEILSGSSAPLLTSDEREFRYYDFSLGYNLLPGEVFFGRGTAKLSQGYILAGAGTTDFAGQRKQTIDIGFGLRLLWNQRFAVQTEVRDHMFSLDLLGRRETTHNPEITLGVTVLF